MSRVLLDTDSLSDVIKGRNPRVQAEAKTYLMAYGQFTFSAITRYEILRGLQAKQAVRQIAIFEVRCQNSLILPLSDAIIVQAARIYGELRR